jgi:hypothetical protein
MAGGQFGFIAKGGEESFRHRLACGGGPVAVDVRDVEGFELFM